MTPDAFRAAYCGTFEPDPLLPQAVRLWRSYYAQCESYDRTVCTGPMGRDGLCPETHACPRIHRAAQKFTGAASKALPTARALCRGYSARL